MKNIVLLLALLIGNNLFAQESSPEVEAAPVGGMERYMEWLDRNITFADSAHVADVRGRVTAEFIVEKDGSLSSVRILDTLGFGVEESLRQVISKSPPWRAGMGNGIHVRSRYRLSVPVNVRQTMGRRSQHPDPRSVARVEAYPSSVRDTSIVDSVSIIAEPSGGMQAYMQWIGLNYRYPQDAVNAGVNGTLLIQFVVERDGSLTHHKVLEDLGHGTAQEAIRLFADVTQVETRHSWWQASQEQGRAADKITYPVVFIG